MRQCQRCLHIRIGRRKGNPDFKDNAVKRLTLVLLLLMASTLLPAQERGDWVLARWQNGDYWFPGVVQNRDGKIVDVVYDDGTRESVPLNRVKPYDWTVGSAVQCRWNAGSVWYSARIRKISGDGVRLSVVYDADGVHETLQTGYCRSQ